MDARLAYFGRSGLQNDGRSQLLSFAPNLARDPVSFDAPLLKPLRFREAISALHDVVISDLRFKKRDKAAYEAWKQAENARLRTISREAHAAALQDIQAQRGVTLPPDFEKQFEARRKRYWTVRQQYSNYLLMHDRDLWRRLMPCDPVVTVADDALLFECFSADESSYGCLTVDRGDAFGPASGAQYGTTNVDYSWDLYHNFQALRSYRETRFRVDPQGFEVATAGSADYREEKIDLPGGWLRGFLQIQVGMTLPQRKVTLSREAVYSILAWHKRHKARTSPRAIRFELVPGQSPRIVLEPWEQTIVSHAARYDGPPTAPIRIWGARRVLTLARVLPLAESFDVYLLGTGFPSYWVARMGEMRLTVGLSGWTTNDWTRSAALDMLISPGEVPAGLAARVAEFVRARTSASLAEISSHLVAAPGVCLAAVNHLARVGQLICDLETQRYRWRQIMPQAVGEADLGPENPELVAARAIVRQGRVKVESQPPAGTELRLIIGTCESTPVELLLDADGLIKRAKCNCSHFIRSGLRRGPCRHLLALRQVALQGASASATSTDGWYDRLQKLVSN
jgi:hypothetical protein